MYEYLSGVLEEKTPTSATLDVGGIGFYCYIPFSSFSELPKTGEVVKLYTSFIVREESQSLYGFFTKHERDLFQMLLSISGIGPKTALALVGNLGLSTLKAAIHDHNITLISKVPGIGKKTAERLIVEMKDKLGHLEKMGLDANLTDVDKLSIDAINALINLGYHHSIAKKAVDKVRKEHTQLNTLIPSALQKI